MNKKMNARYEFRPMDVPTLSKHLTALSKDVVTIHGANPGKIVEYALQIALVAADLALKDKSPQEYAIGMQALLAEAQVMVDQHYLPVHRERLEK